LNLLYASFSREDSGAKGAFNKAKQQCFSFRKEIDNVYLYVSRRTKSILYQIKNNHMEELASFNYRTIPIYEGSNKIRKFANFFAYNSFLKFLDKVIDLYNIDVLYYRISPPSISLIKIMQKKSLIKVIEIPTYPFENEFAKSKTTFEYNLFWKNGMKKLEGFADVIVGVTADNTLKGDKKIVLINNGIRLEDIKIKNQNKNSFINLVSIANVAFWHGYDRIIKGLYEYYKNNPKKEVYYHCVGEGPELENLKSLVKELKLEKYVIFHGTKVGEELDKIVDESDIAFGSLGNHRKGLYRDSALKNREYCARGIPFVIASNDQDFPKSFPYVFRIPQDDSSVDIDKVINWYEDLSKKHPDYSLEMRKYAEENLSWDAKMKPVIEKIKELVNERKSNI